MFKTDTAAIENTRKILRGINDEAEQRHNGKCQVRSECIGERRWARRGLRHSGEEANGGVWGVGGSGLG
jgi:hypothetical protein